MVLHTRAVVPAGGAGWLAAMVVRVDPSQAAVLHASRAYTSAASSYTMPMDDPGSTSWNWHSSTSRHRSHARRTSAAAATAVEPASKPAITALASQSCRARSAAALPAFVRAWLVSVPWCSSRNSSPCHLTASTRRRLAASASKNPRGVLCTTRGMPASGGGAALAAASAGATPIRARCSNMGRLGPPPPSPARGGGGGGGG